jgi:hypothetical protein
MIVSASNSMRSQQTDDTAVDVDVEQNAEDDTEVLRDEESQSRPRKKQMFDFLRLSKIDRVSIT